MLSVSQPAGATERKPPGPSFDEQAWSNSCRQILSWYASVATPALHDRQAPYRLRRGRCSSPFPAVSEQNGDAPAYAVLPAWEIPAVYALLRACIRRTGPAGYSCTWKRKWPSDAPAAWFYWWWWLSDLALWVLLRTASQSDSPRFGWECPACCTRYGYTAPHGRKPRGISAMSQVNTPCLRVVPSYSDGPGKSRTTYVPPPSCACRSSRFQPAIHSRQLRTIYARCLWVR